MGGDSVTAKVGNSGTALIAPGTAGGDGVEGRPLERQARAGIRLWDLEEEDTSEGKEICL